MKDFYLVDDDCLNMFDDIVQEVETCIIAPMSFMKKMVFWILGEDDIADPGIIMINSDNDSIDENDSPYLLCYVPGVEYDLGPFEFSIEGFDGPVFIYDRLNCSYLADLDEENAIPFHYKSEDLEEEAPVQKKKVKVEPINKSEIVTDEDGMTGFTEHFSSGDGGYASYSFYSTDKELVENVANHRAEIIDIMTKRKE